MIFINEVSVMKVIKGLAVLFFLSSCFSFTATGQIYTVVIKLENFVPDEGQMMVGFYGDASNYLQEPTHAHIVDTKAIKGDEIVVEGIPKGTYAISLLQDENRNGLMDKGFLGIPKESFGFSNNPSIFAGAPSFEESRVEIASNLELVIKLRSLGL